MTRMFTRWFALVAIAAATVISTTACQTLRKAELQATYLTIPPGQEAQLGQEYAAEIEKELTIVEDDYVQQWVTELGQSLLAHSPESEQEFVFKVTEDPSINAFAIPGGYCYIQSGLIIAADNEAQVAAVVGHEINHVTMRHGIRSLQRATGIDILASTLASGDASQIMSLVQQAGGLVAMRSFSREDERQADQLGVEAMYGAGYDPGEAAVFFEKLREAQGGSAPAGAGVMGFINEVLSTHPATEERIENIRQQVQGMNLQGNEFTKSSQQFQRVQEILRQKVEGEVPEL